MRSRREVGRDPPTGGRTKKATLDAHMGFAVITEPAFAFNDNGWIIWANEALLEMLGYERNELVGQDTIVVAPKRYHPLHRAVRGRFFSDPDVPAAGRVQTALVQHKDGREIPVERMLNFIDSDDGPLALVTLTDISSRKLTEEQLFSNFTQLELELARRTAELEERLQDVEAVSYAVSHDIQAPLRAMQSFAQALLDSEEGSLGKSGNEFMNQIIYSAEKMGQLTDKLLEFNRVSRAPAALESVNVRELFEDVLSYLAPYLQAANAEVTHKADDLNVRADYATMFQVLTNLLTNAVKYARPGRPPRTSLSAEPSDNCVVIWMEDNGIGICARDRQRIFRMFERIEHPGHPAGSGVGLAIVKRGVERMKGRVGVESRHGKGSRFWVELPVA